MPGLRPLAVAACLGALASSAPAQDRAQPPGASRTIRSINITGAKELSEDAVRREVPVQIGIATSDSIEHIAETLEHHYHDQGYTFAQVTPLFDAATGPLSLTFDEGIIGCVEFQGV